MKEDLVWAPECPMCNSKDVDESIIMKNTEVWVEKECLKCSVEWIDFYTFSGMDIIDPQ